MSYDHLVVLDHAKFTQLKDCLGEQQAILGNNAISTATTLQFYHAPEEITNGYVLAKRIAGKSEKEALALISQYIKREQTFHFEQFIACLEANSSRRVAEKLEQMYGKELSAIQLRRFLKAWNRPAAEIETRMQQYKNEIQNGRQLSKFLAAFPEEANLVIKEQGNKINNGDELASCLSACPAEAKMLIQMYGHVLKNRWDMDYCLGVCSAAESKMLIQVYEHNGGEIDENIFMFLLSLYPEEAKKLIQQHGNKLKDAENLGYCLRACPAEYKMLLQAYENNGGEIDEDVLIVLLRLRCLSPEEEKKLIQQHGNKIKNGRELICCLKACPAEADMLIQIYGNEIKDGEELAAHLIAYPEKAKLLIQKYGHTIQNGKELAECLEACPIEAETLTHVYKDERIDADALSIYLRLYPEKAERLIKMHGGKIRYPHDLISCLESCPEKAEILLQIHNIDICSWSMLRQHIMEFPAGIGLVLQRHADEISSKISTDFFGEEECLFPFLERYFSSHILDRFYKAQNVSSIADQKTIDGITCLYIGSINRSTAEQIVAYLHTHTLPNLSFVEVANCTEGAIPHLERILEVLQEKKYIYACHAACKIKRSCCEIHLHIVMQRIENMQYKEIRMS